MQIAEADSLLPDTAEAYLLKENMPNTAILDVGDKYIFKSTLEFQTED
jgi:hypothetical protein